MDKLLYAISSELKVRIVEKEELILEGVPIGWKESCSYKAVSEEVKELFEKELSNHIFDRFKQKKVGEHVEYSFNFENVKHHGTPMEEASENLKEVLLKLPKLKENESYVLPCNTYVRFKLKNKKKKEITVDTYIVSSWIMEAYDKQ